MPGKGTSKVRAAPPGNFGVPAGAVILIVCFFLPWVSQSGGSAMQLSGDPTKAASALTNLGIPYVKPLAVTRTLYLIPLLGLSTLMLELSVPPGHAARAFARFAILAGGAVLCAFFAFLGLEHGPKLTYGFWGSFMGSLFITVGVLFDVFRNE